MEYANSKYAITEEIPYPLGYVEKILDKTLEKYGKKLNGFNRSMVFNPRTEEIGKRRSQILSERHVISINDESSKICNSSITYYRSIPIQEVGKNGRYCREVFKDFSSHGDNSTIEHIGIKHENYDLEMIVTFAGRLGSVSCKREMTGYISERPYSKPKKRLTSQDNLRVKTRKFFVDAFNNYFNSNLKYKDFSKEFCMEYFLVLNQESIDSLSEIAINYSSPLLKELFDAKAKLPTHRRKKLRTDEFIEMIVDYVEK